MTDEPRDRFDEILKVAALTYNTPPAERDMPLAAMWRDIERDAWAGTVTRGIFRGGRGAPRAKLPAWWLAIAAALVVGIGIGRVSNSLGIGTRPSPAIGSLARASVDSAPRAADARRVAEATPPAVDPATSRYLGQAAALLIALPTESNGARADASFTKRANDLLLTTRLLLDSPSATDQGLRALLEDLELVLVQVVQLEQGRAPARRTELELIQQALDQRDVLPRLRSAASEHAADD